MAPRELMVPTALKGLKDQGVRRVSQDPWESLGSKDFQDLQVRRLYAVQYSRDTSSGVRGFSGVTGITGIGGPMGPDGIQGEGMLMENNDVLDPQVLCTAPVGESWKPGRYFCPGGGNLYTRLVDCDYSACRLETQYNGVSLASYLVCGLMTSCSGLGNCVWSRLHSDHRRPGLPQHRVRRRRQAPEKGWRPRSHLAVTCSL